MGRPFDNLWNEETIRQLSVTLAAISDIPTMQNFMRDVMTEKEIIEMSARLQAAKMLSEGRKYTEIAEKTKLSSRTIARISEWLQKGNGGYQAALKAIGEHHQHTSPDRAR